MARVWGQNLRADLIKGVFPAVSLVAMMLIVMAVAEFAAVPSLSDHIVERGVLEDRSGMLAIDDIVGKSFSPVQPVFLAGYTKSAHWFRIVVSPAVADEDLTLRIRPAFLDRVELYAQEPDGPGFRLEDVTGDTVPYKERSLASVSLALTIEPHEPRTVYYLRLQSTSTSLFSVQALEEHVLRQAVLREDILLGLFMAVMGWILLWAARDCLLRPQRVTFLFCLSHLCYSAFTLAIMGYLAPLLPDRLEHSADYITSLLCCITPLLAISLHRAAFMLYAPAKLVSRIALVMNAGAVCVIFVFLFADDRQFALELNTSLIFFSSFFFFILALSPMGGAKRMPMLLKAILGLQAVSIVLSMSPLLGFASFGEWTFRYPYILGLIYMLLMFLFLHGRSMQQERKSRENRLRLELVTQALDAERRQRNMQSRFVAMLTHEIKTPLSVIRLSLDRDRMEADRYRDIDEALNDMNATVERCYLAEQFESREFSVTGEYVDIRDALREAVARHAPSSVVDLEADTAGGMECDRHMLTVILSNLLDNAVKYSRSETPISIFARPDVTDGAQGVEIIIENRIGRAGAPDPDRVFEKFYRTPGARTKSGAGLGLYIVQGITEFLGGTIGCTVSGDLVHFRLWLPRTQPLSPGRDRDLDDLRTRPENGNAHVPRGLLA